MQFHWWDYLSFSYLDAARHLQRLKERGLIRNLGLTNFDAAHLRILLSLGVEIATNQVHYSLLDRRAAGAMAALCAEGGVGLLCYGTLAGGFLSERWLGRPEPAEGEIAGNWSLLKYHRFIQVFGGWELFQELLRALADIAGKHEVSISNVAVRWVLEQPAVAAVLVGARLGLSDHTEDNLRVFGFSLDPEDHARLDAVFARSRPIPGDCGDEYRKPPFLTASGDLSHHQTRAWRKPLLPAGPNAATPRTSYGTGTSWEKQASYSRAVRIGDRVTVSGTTASYKGGVIGTSDAAAQAHFCVDIIESALQALGAELTDVIRTRLYVPHMARDWRAVAGVHGERFAGIRPANTLVSTALVGPDYLVEMEADAFLGGGRGGA
jgi:diketogulonate reductase-like aldo/keto reductase/enamine deaminase RidA (YjgF/YER057c/UK114 family)